VVGHFFLAIGVVFGINLLPAFGPPTWAVLVYFRYRYDDIPVAALIIGGAVAATAGRYLLALAFRRFGHWLPPKRRESLEVLGRALGQSRGGLISSFLFFAVAPVPSAQMFEAAGLAGIKLGPLVGAFFVGRLVSYSIYVGTASAAHKSIEKLFDQGFTSPQAIATQVIAVVVLIAIVKIDWPTTIDKVRAWWAAKRGRPKPRPIRETLMPEAPTAPASPKTQTS
jgi:membrane protein YqaA with SNARE-associated domain